MKYPANIMTDLSFTLLKHGKITSFVVVGNRLRYLAFAGGAWLLNTNL